MAIRKKTFPNWVCITFEQSTRTNEMSTSCLLIKFEIREGKVELANDF
jgi:hypothetical protein